MYIYNYFIHNKNIKTIVEIGVCNGCFLLPITYINNNILSYGIDPYKSYIQNDIDNIKYQSNILTTNVILLDNIYNRLINNINKFNLNIKIIKDESENCAIFFENNNIDILHIDGNHNYDYVLKDLLLYHEKIKDNGIIIINNINLICIKNALDTFLNLINKFNIIYNNSNFCIIQNNISNKNLKNNYDISNINIIPSKSRQIERWSKLQELNVENLTCIICDYTDLYEKFQKLYANDLFNAGKLTRHKCPNCGLVFGDLKFLNLSPEELKYDYEDLYSYYNENFTPFILNTIKSIKLFENKNFSYLEYECKNENTIKTLKNNGYNIYGFNKYIINNQNILNIIKNMKFDVIYVFNFVEHLINPIIELQHMLSYLNPAGFLIIMSDTLDKYKYEKSHYKTYYYLENSFNILCNKLNLKIISSQIINEIKVKILQKNI
jgi:hypothetical protein